MNEQTIAATKELSTRYNDEKMKRISAEDRLKASDERAIAAEKISETLHRTREHVSGAVLGALHTEKNRSALLQQQLHTSATATAAMPPTPPTTADDDFSPSVSCDSNVNASINSINTSPSSTGKDVKAELARLRQELNQMESKRP